MWSSGAGGSRHGVPPEFFFVAPEGVSTFDPNVAIGVIPLLTAAPCHAPTLQASEEGMSARRSSIGFGMHLWQQQQQGQRLSSSSSTKPIIPEASNAMASCQDCGNQAKRDCSHQRCRTCCKSRGFDCTTHVKSTWVPAARRRDRAAASSQSTPGSKKQKLGGASETTNTTSASNTTPTRSFDTISKQQGGGLGESSFPGQVRAPAVFKCVRVTALDDDADQYAYQAVVRIGGHVFRGFLYDHGVEAREGLPNLPDLHLSGGNTNNAASSSHRAPLPADIYDGGGGMEVTKYGNPLN